MKKAICMLAALALTAAGIPAAMGETAGEADHHRVFYEIFVGSFSDSDGDGTGDLGGILRRMDYLNDGNAESESSLGVEGLWLTPVFRSPSYHKYDVEDYGEIDPQFGTEEDFRALAEKCHERGVLLIMDLPLNHTGSGHPWFREFAEAHRKREESHPRYNWYTWIRAGEPVPAGRRFMPLEGTDILYECNFSDDMPELNYDEEAVREEAARIGREWLEKGADGFRLDAAKYLFLGDAEKNVAFWKEFTEKLREVKPQVYTVAEVWSGEAETNRYVEAVNCFRFSASQAEGAIATAARGGNISKYVKNTADYLETLAGIRPDAMHIPFIANHDTDRAAGYLPAAGGRAAMAANVYLLTPGSPFLYYGEEIGLKGSRGGAATDANRRLAMRWGDGDTVRDPEGSDYANQTEATVAQMLAEEGSLLNHYRRVIAARKAYPEIARGSYEPLAFEGTKAGGFLCSWQGQTSAVIHNTTGKEAVLDIREASGREFTEIAEVLGVSPGREGAALEEGVLTLAPQTTVILR